MQCRACGRAGRRAISGVRFSNITGRKTRREEEVGQIRTRPQQDKCRPFPLQPAGRHVRPRKQAQSGFWPAEIQVRAVKQMGPPTSHDDAERGTHSHWQDRGGAKEVREQCKFMECFPRFRRFAYFLRNKIGYAAELTVITFLITRKSKFRTVYVYT